MFLGFVVFVSHADAAYVAKPGDLLRTVNDPTVVLVMDDGTRVPLSADAYAVRYNNNFSLVKTVTEAERGTYDSMNITLNHLTSLAPSTVFIYEVDQPGIYKVENGFKRLFMTWSGFEAAGYSLNDVQWVGEYTWYPTGAPVQ